jgi:hypothetical protein
MDRPGVVFYFLQITSFQFLSMRDNTPVPPLYKRENPGSQALFIIIQSS